MLVGFAMSFAGVNSSPQANAATQATPSQQRVSENLVDVETLAKEIGITFHWYPVQRTFILEGKKDTVKFAVGLPFASINGKSVNLSKVPAIGDGRLWIAQSDASVISESYKSTASANADTTLKPTASRESAPKSSALEESVKKEPIQSKQPSKSDSTKKGNPKTETAGTREVKTIVIDPGHGGKDSGALGKKAQEKDIVLSVAKLLRDELKKAGFNVKLTRDKDVFIELGQRANLANQWDGDLFISLHCNAVDATPERKKLVRGYHIYVLRAPESEEDKAIARRENKVATLYGEKNAKEELSPLEWFKLEARLEKYKQNSYMFTEELLKANEGYKIRKQAGGVGGAGFMVLVGALMPAVLYEIGFISNLEDEAYMMTHAGQKDIAERIAKAVSNYKNAVNSYRETLGR